MFRDSGGRVIDYGSRWQGSPPWDTYSVDTHPDRFAPLHVVAEGLIEHLRENYDVEVDERAAVVGDLMLPSFHDVIRAVRIRPNRPESASVILVFTAYPGIYMHAGLLHDFHYPVCGCDACDSTWQAEADQLEQQVFAVVNGGYRRPSKVVFDEVSSTRSPTDGASSGWSQSGDLPADRFKAAKPVLRGHPEGWAPWPRSETAS